MSEMNSEMRIEPGRGLTIGRSHKPSGEERPSRLLARFPLLVSLALRRIELVNISVEDVHNLIIHSLSANNSLSCTSLGRARGASGFALKRGIDNFGVTI